MDRIGPCVVSDVSSSRRTSYTTRCAQRACLGRASLVPTTGSCTVLAPSVSRRLSGLVRSLTPLRGRTLSSGQQKLPLGTQLWSDALMQSGHPSRLARVWRRRAHSGFVASTNACRGAYTHTEMLSARPGSEDCSRKTSYIHRFDHVHVSPDLVHKLRRVSTKLSSRRRGTPPRGTFRPKSRSPRPTLHLSPTPAR